MTLYEINDSMLALVNEDGEIEDFEKFEQLQMEREAKIENTGLWIKNELAEADAIKNECDALMKRRNAALHRAERLKEHLARAIEGEKYKSPRLTISWRPSEAVEISPACVEWCMEHGEFLREKPPEIDKAAIKNALKHGGAVPGASLVKRQNIQIK